MKVIVIQNRMGIGDLIIFLPYIFSISQEYNMPVSLLVRKNARAKELLKNNPHVSEIITLDRDDKNRTGRHQGVAGILNLIQDLRKRNFTKSFTFNSSIFFSIFFILLKSSRSSIGKINFIDSLKTFTSDHFL